MRFKSIVVLGLVACATGARGPSDAEVQTLLEGEVQGLVAGVSAGDAEAVVARFVPDGRLVLSGITGPDGNPLDTEIVGAERIRGFMASIGAPPSYAMNVRGFTRSGDTATQTGTWSVDSGAQAGSFTLEWRRTEDGMWRITTWSMQGG